MEREWKKQQSEEEQRLKPEAKDKQTVEREETKAKWEASKAKKEAAKVERGKEKHVARMKCNSQSDPRIIKSVKKRVWRGIEAGEDGDHCCMCFGSYQEDIDTGRECFCTRWLHEDCTVMTMGNCAPLVKYIEYIEYYCLYKKSCVSELNLKWLSGLVVIDAKVGKSSFVEVMSAKGKCAYWPITNI